MSRYYKFIQKSFKGVCINLTLEDLPKGRGMKRPHFQELDVDIDFDGASKAWLANKIRKGQSYVYKCIVPNCEKEVVHNSLCKIHTRTVTIVGDTLMITIP